MLDQRLDYPSVNRQVNPSPYSIIAATLQAKPSPKREIFISRSNDLQKSLHQAAFRNIHVKQIARKHQQPDLHPDDGTILKKGSKSDKISRKGSTASSSQKQENMFGIVYSHHPSLTEVCPPTKPKKQKEQAEVKSPKHVLHKIPSVSLNSQVTIQKKEPEYILVPETFSQKSHDSYTHFKKTLTSFWVKSGTYNNNSVNISAGNILSHQRQNSDATKPEKSKRDIGTADYNTRRLIGEERGATAINVARRNYLGFAKIDVADSAQVGNSNVSPTYVPQSRLYEKSGNELGSGRKLDDAISSRNEMGFYYVNVKSLKPVKNKHITEGEINISTNSKDSTKLNYSNDYQMKTTFFHSKIKRSDVDVHFETQTTPRDSTRHSKQPAAFNIRRASGHTEISTSHGVRRKLKETVSQVAEYGVSDLNINSKGAYIPLSPGEPRPFSFLIQEKHLSSKETRPSEVLDSSQGPGSRTRIGTASVTGEGRRPKGLGERTLTSKMSPSHAESLFKDIDNFKIEGWDEEDAHNEF